MAKKIAISGIIANYEMESESNVTPATLRKSLEDANGEDLLITINSPGGSVFAGLEMFSLIQNYSGNTETRIVSLAASMGSVLALAGDKKSIENTALYFIHNAQGVGFGDYRDLANESEFLKDISVLIANLYTEYTSLTLPEARELMDADSSFFGVALAALGFDVVNGSGEPSEPSARVNARMKFQEAHAKMTDEKYSDNIEKAAASIDFKKFGITSNAKPTVPTPTPASAGTTPQEATKMDLKAFLAANPDAQAEYDSDIATAKAGGKAEGVTAGKAEVQATIAVASPFLANEKYPTLGALALKVINGEESATTLTVSVTAIDALVEQTNQSNAEDESGKIPESAGGGQQSTAEKTEADFQARMNAHGKV